jgi:hypothetical protein
VPFLKFYNFNGATGERQLEVSIDGRGVKAMPGICISCHGGRGDPLTPPDAQGRRHFPIVANGVSQARGDVQAHFHPLEADAIAFSDRPGWTRAEQEANIKKINTVGPLLVPQDGGGYVARGCLPPRGGTERMARHRRRAHQVRVRRQRLAERDVQGRVRARIVAARRPVDALSHGDRDLVPRVPRDARRHRATRTRTSPATRNSRASPTA